MEPLQLPVAQSPFQGLFPRRLRTTARAQAGILRLSWSRQVNRSSSRAL